MRPRAIATWLIYPLVVGGGMTAGYCGIAAGIDGYVMVAILGLAAMVVAALLERVHTYQESWKRSRGDFVPDFLHWIVSSLGGGLLVNVTLLAALAAVAPLLADVVGTGLWPTTWPLVLQLVIALVVGELGQYWAHRMLHERPLLWRIHSVHHSAERMYWLNANRNHVLDVMFQYSGLYAPLVLLGAPEVVLALVAMYVSLHTPLQHGNVLVRTGPLSFLLSTPELHRWHHAPGLVGNHNYGGNVILWDLVFRSFHHPPEECTEVGIDLPDYPRTYLAQVLVPLRWPPKTVPRRRDGFQ